MVDICSKNLRKDNLSKELILSIVIPVYNTPIAYLERTIKCAIFLCANLNAEIILVDDGSNVELASWLDSYAEDVPAIKRVIHQSNSGQNAARRAGLNVCAGEYVLFLDSDDLIFVENFRNIEQFLNLTRPDILMYDYEPLTIEELDSLNLFSLDLDSTFSEVEKDIYLAKDCNSLSMALYKKTLLDSIHEPFCIGPRIGEDVVSSFRIGMKAGSIYYTNTILYVYLQRSESANHAVDVSKANDIIRAFSWLYTTSNSEIRQHSQAASSFVCRHLAYSGALRILRWCNDSAHRKRLLDEMSALLDSDYPTWRNGIRGAISKLQLSLPGRIGFKLIINRHWSIYLLLSKIREALRN